MRTGLARPRTSVGLLKILALLFIILHFKAFFPLPMRFAHKCRLPLTLHEVLVPVPVPVPLPLPHPLPRPHKHK